MRNRSQNGHDEKKLRALDWWVHFQKRLTKPPTHTPTPFGTAIG